MQNWAGKTMIYCWTMPLAAYSVFIITHSTNTTTRLMLKKNFIKLMECLVLLTFLNCTKKKKRQKINSKSSLWVTYMQCSTQKVILATVILKVVKISDTFVIWCWEKLKTLLPKVPWQLLRCMELWWGVRNQSFLLLEVLLLCLDRCFTCLEH